MNRRAVFIALLGAACQPPTADPSISPAPPSRAAVAEIAPSPAPPAAEPPAPLFAPEVKSLRLKRSIVVRFAPDIAAKNIGTVLSSTRVAWKSAAAGPGCDRWIEIEPRGWICDKYLEPSAKPPWGQVLPVLAEGELVPGEYGKVSGTGVTVRKVGEVKVGARTFWKTSDGQKIDVRRIRLDVPSTFAGMWLAPGDPMPAWARKNKQGVTVRAAPHTRALAVGTLPARERVSILEMTVDDAWAKIGEARWVATSELHVARASAPPVDVRGDQERWLDVDLDEQVVIAFEGRRPVYATLVSSGAKKWPTPSGIYRIWLKFAETDMSGQMGDEQPYSVATVPWTMFFAKDFAFHTAYWHDKFGDPRSHGCVNLSPRDARALYDWALPDVPAGWTMAHGIFERPGSIVRIHGRQAPATEYRGYAKVVHEKNAG